MVEYKIKEKEDQITILINFGNEDIAYQNQEKQAILSTTQKSALTFLSILTKIPILSCQNRFSYLNNRNIYFICFVPKVTDNLKSHNKKHQIG